MAFRKAKPEQATLKVSMFGPPGSGKTLSALLFAEGIAKYTQKRIAYIDTERGTDFYAQAVPAREFHPDAFDFDAVYTRSITEAIRELKALRPDHYSVIVIDSITHFWEAAKAAYTGKVGPNGQIPMHAWGRIKSPYKELMHLLINSPYHVFILGRQGTEFAEEEGELKAVGVKMKAEGETAYEPHICLRMESVRVPSSKKGQGKARESIPTLFAEKDRSGILQGLAIEWPTFEKVIAPLLGILGHTQAQMQSEETAAHLDSEALDRQEREKAARSRALADRYKARFQLADSLAELDAISKEITPEVKRQMAAEHVSEVREAYTEARRVKVALLPAGPTAVTEPVPSKPQQSAANGAAQKPAKPSPPATISPLSNGLELRTWLGKLDTDLAVEGHITKGDLLSHMSQQGVHQLWSDDLSTWDKPEQIAFAVAEASRYVEQRKTKHDGGGVAFFNQLEELDAQLFREKVIAERADFRQRVIEYVQGNHGAHPEVPRWTEEQVNAGKDYADLLSRELTEEAASV